MSQRKFLIVVDMQNDFIDGSLGTREAQAIVPAVAARIRECREAGWAVIATLDTHEENYLDTREGRFLPVRHCIRDTEGWRIREGELCLPLGALCKLFSLEAARQEDGSLALSTEHAALLSAGADWYELNFPADDVYWLSHIIAAEARFEPLDGQIGVGNVVMNRVRDPRFPGDVFGVIYDTEHTIQFEPIALGGIREEPGEQAMIAACLVLEGADTVGDSLYFVNPASGSGWFDANLELVAVIGNHNFYAQPTN